MMRPLAAIVLIASMLCAGCTFERAWDAAGVAPEGGVAGQWEGIWKSDKSRSHGGLRCAIRQISPDTCEAYFHATHGVVFALNQQVNMRVWRADGDWQFSGSEDLGVMNGGLFEYNGHLHGDRFTATYRSPVDFGTFILTRVHGDVVSPPATRAATAPASH